ncbi:MAG: Ldh family oxidoreductase [Actinophytocola sp.]|uniref:Ldh family oxidoreductase n=1 Tax=Actinophytocola sp. TaxID=1872138 RepID=UPI001326F4B6|nr:Ldh family oxidoreductase [Actinophytocola sp.]MPZ82798.1 Ldh family oxidoreductase [Actinophytocola sp.]
MTDARLTVAEARALATRLLTASGMPQGPATRSAELLVLADVWGIGSHGLLRLPYYLARLAAGGMNPVAELRVVRDLGAVIAYDGADGLGHWQVWSAAETAAARAAEHGIAMASVGRSSHCGSLGLYTIPGLAQGLVSLVFSTGPAVMAAPGTAVPLLSTSPIAAGVPTGPKPAIVDLATSAAARGKIAAHAKRGEPLPSGWAVDAEGVPTTDPVAALSGMLAPLGGGKGFALAFLVEALAGACVGPELATGVPDMFDPDSDGRAQRIGHLVVTLDPAAIGVDGDGPQRLDRLAKGIVAAGGRVPGSARPLPDQVDDDQPVTIAGPVLSELDTWSGRLGL